jgi:hypothetical protein
MSVTVSHLIHVRGLCDNCGKPAVHSIAVNGKVIRFCDEDWQFLLNCNPKEEQSQLETDSGKTRYGLLCPP